MIQRELKAQRELKGYTQEKLAKKSGISVPTIARIEKTGEFKSEVLKRLCEALDTEFDCRIKLG